MRVIITGGGLLTVLALFVMINCTVISREARDNEVAATLDSAMEYAMDLLGESYRQNDYSENTDQAVENIMRQFCEALRVRIGSDGEVKVRLLDYNISNGLFHVEVVESYQYPIRDMMGSCMCEKTIVFRE